MKTNERREKNDDPGTTEGIFHPPFCSESSVWINTAERKCVCVSVCVGQSSGFGNVVYMKP